MSAYYDDLALVRRALIEGMVGCEYSVQLDDNDPVKVKITGQALNEGASVSRIEIKGRPCLTMITQPEGTRMIEVDWPTTDAEMKLIARIWQQLTKPRADQ